MVFTEINGFEHPTEGTRIWVIVVEDLGDRPSAPDTVGHKGVGNWSYGGAWSAKRKWVAFGDRVGLRLLYSDTAKVWREIDVPGSGDAGIAMAAIDDTTALLVWGGTFEKLRWGYVRGTTFEEGPPPPGLEAFAAVPVLRRRPSGGWWVLWATKENHVSIATLAGTTWTDRESVQCAYQPPGVYYTNGTPALSDDLEEYPVVGWSAADVNFARRPFCVTCPDESGFPVAQEAPTAWNAGVPRVARDRNGDVWVAYDTEDIQGMYWFHTYVRATTDAPTATGSIGGRTVAWSLSEPAPDSWWAVLRAPEGGEFEPVGRVKAAGSNTQLAFFDDAIHPGPLRYRIRRESVDRRYEWRSPEVTWVFDPTPALVSLQSAAAEPGRVRLVWAGHGAGALEAAVQRREAASAWEPHGAAVPEGGDRLSYVDTSVEPGRRYGYRLAYQDESSEQFTAETWVEVPLAPELALEGLRPNPSLGPTRVAFTLPAAGDARIEVLDVAGRRVARRDVGPLAAGRHVVELAEARSLAPGVYVIRLSFAGRTLQARGVVMK
jgi:hypothetical protein